MGLGIKSTKSRIELIRFLHRKDIYRLKETISKKIEISMETLHDLVDSLPEEERQNSLQRLKAKPVILNQFKKAKIDAILADFESTNLYEDDFLKNLEEGLEKSSLYQ